MKLVIRWAITAVALVAAVWLIPGIRIESQNAWIAVGIMAVILGFVNAIIRPVLMFLSCGCIVLTMGLFMILLRHGWSLRSRRFFPKKCRIVCGRKM